MKSELFKTDRNVKVLIVSDKGGYNNIFCCNSKLFKSDIEFVADFECEELEDLLGLLKPDVLLSEKGVKLDLKAITPMKICEVDGIQITNNNGRRSTVPTTEAEVDGIQIANNNGALLLWYQNIAKDKIKTYCTLSFLINHSYETKNKLGVEK